MISVSLSSTLRYQECHPEYGGSYCGGRGTKSSLCHHATRRLFLRRVPESPAPVSRSCGHHPAQEHVCYAPGHSTGNNTLQWHKSKYCAVFCSVPLDFSCFFTVIVCSSKMLWCHSAELCFALWIKYLALLYLQKRSLSDAFSSDGNLWQVNSKKEKSTKEASAVALKWMWSTDTQHKKESN